jgi:ribose transport system substrate-binding protein
MSRSNTAWSRLAKVLAVTVTMVGLAAAAGCGSSTSSSSPPSSSSSGTPTASGQYGENYNAPSDLRLKAFGTTTGIPQPLLAAVTRAAVPFTGAKLQLALQCWKQNICNTGTGGKLTVAEADGFGDNVWREVTHMELVLQALTYPQIGKIIYTNGHSDVAQQISDLKSLIAQGVNVIVGFPDAGAAVLPEYRQATQRGIIAVPYISSPAGTPGQDYLTFVAEDLCQLGKNFAGVLNTSVGSGNVIFLGGTPGNLLSKSWQTCEKPALNKSINVVGTADTNWTRQGTLQAMSAFLSKYPNIKGISYEYADGFLGGLRAYQAAGKPVNVALTLRTDEEDLFCQWKQLNNPNFKVWYSSGGGFDPRFALTAAMMKVAGDNSIPANLVVPIRMHRVTAATCNTAIPGQGPASTLVPLNVLQAMYPGGK